MKALKTDADTAAVGPALGAGDDTPVSSPAATGGAGTTFEQHVGAYWLAQLLVRAIPPVLIDRTVTEVSFQTERLGWQTDDFLVVSEGAGAPPRKLAGQVKRSFTLSASDKDCVQAIGDFWKDFNNAGVFSPDTDRLALVTLRGTNTLLEHFVGLLDCARASRDGADFARRLATEGFISDKAVDYCAALQKIIGDLEGKAVTPADIWLFLRVLDVVSLDLHTSTRQHEAHIKSLLALTATEGDPAAIAAASWNELVVEASTAMAASRSLRRADLPETLQARHGAIGTNEQRVLIALKDHTAPVLRNIGTTIGKDFHLARAALVQKVLSALEGAQVVLVTGPAGSGKSAVGKEAVNVLAQHHFMFGFRVEEFAQPHFDATLAAAQVPASRAKLAAILGAQDRKVILVESVERLLEKTPRDAFNDLMTLAADDPGVRIVLTCRDYSLELVRTSFLQPHGINHHVIRVPPLDDAELDAIENAYPALAIPLKNPTLRNLLRNPFLLDKALGIPWSADRPLPQSEREFRALFWRQIVRADHRVAPGMGRRREEALEEIAIRRARALSAYVLSTDLDPEVVDSLRSDSLISSPADNLLLVATAHDVLEDWAILQWLEEQHLAEASFRVLSAAIGAHPAIRRSYRKWVAELVDRDTAAADRLFEAAVGETDISVQFRDDTLVSLLKAPSAPDFLARHEAQLLTNDRAVLKRVIHLLRVACVKTADWLAPYFTKGSIFNVPDGSAWPAVLRLVHRNLAVFAPNERALLISLVEDSVRGVSAWAPEVEDAEFIAGIAHWLLEGMRGYGGEDVRKRVLQTIAKIPNADPVRFEAVLRGHIEEGERRDLVSEEFQELIYEGIDGMPAARDLPDVVISVGADYLLVSEEDLKDEHRYAGSRIEVDLYFGIDDELRHDAFPSSAIRGPWSQLLRFHPVKALSFYAKVFNHSADWYAHPRLRDRLEPAWEVELTFTDGSTKKQWVNGRLWGLYRGMTVGPYTLQSMLMALEAWLLELGKQTPELLDGVLVNILRHNDNAALTAVVAGVATAYPHASGETLLALLSVRDFITLDRSRMVNESQMSAMDGMFPTLRADHQIYERINKEANARPHRTHDLEAAIANLQFGPYAERVQALFDKHLAALPAIEQQDRDDKLWRLAIHRMDFRQYTRSEVSIPATSATEGTPSEPPKRYIRFDPKPVDADVQALVDEGAERTSTMNARLGLLMWGLHAFQRQSGKHDPAQWSARLAEAQAMDREADEEDFSRHGPGLVAAVCIRDRWEEMTQEQCDWCVDVVCSEVLRHADDADHMVRVQNNGMAADRAGAFVLALLLGKPLALAQTQRVRMAFAAAMTHPVDEVRSYATWSIDETVWSINRALALRCINAIAGQAAIIDAAQKTEEARRYDKRRKLDTIIPAATADIRARFWQDGAIADDAYVTLDVSDWFGVDALKRILVIFGRVPQDPLAVACFTRAASALVDSWNSDDDRANRRSRDFHGESDISQRLQEFLLRTTPEAAQQVLAPILGAVDRHDRELQTIMQGLTGMQDSNPNTPQYWFLWGLFADAVKRAQWVPRLDTDRHPSGSELLSAVFLTAYWKDDVRHWRFLAGYAHLVDLLFEALPPSAIVLDDYTRFLFHIGERSLPGAFVRITDALQRGDARKMLSKSNTVFMLESILQRHVYGRPLELKRDSRIRDAVLFILDWLVEMGSSAAFRMRDDFVTPAA
jgi:hypothetical protein